MKKNRIALISNLLLLLTAIIWGFAFVAQSVGMNYVGPWTFVFTRFIIAAILLLPLTAFSEKNYRASLPTAVEEKNYKTEALLGAVLVSDHFRRSLLGKGESDPAVEYSVLLCIHRRTDRYASV